MIIIINNHIRYELIQFDHTHHQDQERRCGFHLVTELVQVLVKNLQWGEIPLPRRKGQRSILRSI
jgi:hypothetical protein